LHQAPRGWYETLATYLLENGFQRGKIDQTLLIKKQKVSTPIDTEKPLLKDLDGEDVDVHIYRLMIGSLMKILQESFKKLRAEVKVSSSESTQDTPTKDPKEMSEEDVKNMLEIVPVTEFKVEYLHVNYPLIDWEIYSEG
nr:putative ribonuclease H-like domain-containing protein [Tanacetum cinerariifolium]